MVPREGQKGPSKEAMMKQAALMMFAPSLCIALAMSAGAATKTDAIKASYLTNATGTVTWDGIAATDNGQYSCLKPRLAPRRERQRE